MRYFFSLIALVLVNLAFGQVSNPEDIRMLTDGFHTIFFENGSKYYGEIYEGEFSGKGTMVWSDSSYYEGRWMNGMRHGKGNMVWPDGKKFVLNNVKQGLVDLMWN